MRFNTTSILLFAAAFAAGTTLSSCGCGGGNADGQAAGTADSTASHDATAHGDHDGHDHGTDGAAHMDTRDTTVSGAQTNATLLTPAQERTKTGDDMRGLRAVLVAELDQVRARLKQGTRTADEKKADQTRAAELAQGLERIDRAIKAIDEATDVTWGTIRESQMKEAGEVRAWMAKYGMNVTA
jgi:hypothetical protein